MSAFTFNDWPENIQTSFTDVYNSCYSSSVLTFEEAKDASVIFSSLSAPSWENVADWIYPAVKTDPDFTSISTLSLFARTIFVENANVDATFRYNAMCATGNMIQNRVVRSEFPSTIEEVILEGDFPYFNSSSVRISNPLFYQYELGYWLESLLISKHLTSSLLSKDIIYYIDVSETAEELPFYVTINERCTSENVEEAEYYFANNEFSHVDNLVRFGCKVFFSCSSI
jgi:hypothetical protein